MFMLVLVQTAQQFCFSELKLLFSLELFYVIMIVLAFADALMTKN